MTAFSIQPPRQVLSLLDRLESAGFEAWVVGGCVRDSLLGKVPFDWDVTTSARPEETAACLEGERLLQTGAAHGTVALIPQEGRPIEITTFRADGPYLDGRHPEGVTFVSSLEADLARRDFTVNAMAMDLRGALADPFGGQADLKGRILRAVGEPEQRFREDALRMLRALRFAAQLDFSLEAGTDAAIRRCHALTAALSAERVRDEVEKTLLSPRPGRVGEMAALGLLATFGFPEGRDTGWLSRLPATAEVRWAGLCRTYPELDLAALRLPRRLSQDAMAAAQLSWPEDRLGRKQLLSAHGETRGRIAAALAGDAESAEEILASGECLYLRDLAVSGADFPQLRGPEVGRHLQALLAHVLAHPGDNRREVLLRLA